MKKVKLIIFLTFVFLFNLGSVNANTINSIDVNVQLDKYGNGKVTEKWDMKVNKGTEVYKPLGNLGNSVLSDFRVTDENGRVFQDVGTRWNIDWNLSEKAYKSGMNKSKELNWGMSSYGNHVYTLTYNVSNMIFNTSDNQVLYWKFINDSMDPAPKNFKVTVNGMNNMGDELPVWGYGYKGYAYVQNSIISMSNEENTTFGSSDYAVLLVQYPKDTFETINSYSQFSTFDDVKNKATEGSYAYDYSESFFEKIFYYITMIFTSIIPIFIFAAIFRVAKKTSSNLVKKPFKMKDVNNFRDIPCNKDIFVAYYYCKEYNLCKKETDLLGAVLLKWLKEGRITIENREVHKLFGSKEEQCIDLTKPQNFDNELEQEMFEMMHIASVDGILETDELKKWCKKHYSKFFDWFKDVSEDTRDRLVEQGKITRTSKGKVFGIEYYGYQLNDEVYPDIEHLFGLKKYLIEFSRMKEKQPIEVAIWDYYLIFAQLFGIADEVAEQFKELYPELVQNPNNNINMNHIYLVNNITSTGVRAASSARSAAESYHSGGGGFSSGGGGGGSFGGGSGGGCR